MRQPFQKGIPRLVLKVLILVNKLIEMRTHDPIVLPRLQAVVGRVEISNKAEGRAADGVELLGIICGDGDVERPGVAACWVVPVPEVAQQRNVRKGDDLKSLLMYFAPLVVLELVAPEKQLELGRQLFESQGNAGLARVHCLEPVRFRTFADHSLFGREPALSELLQQIEVVVLEERVGHDGIALELGKAR